MTTLQEMHDRTTSSNEFDRMIRSVEPLCDYFNVNHFFYGRICTNDRNVSFSALGTHLKWQEYLFQNVHILTTWPAFKLPNALSPKINFEKNTDDSKFNNALEIAWLKFNINMTLSIQKHTPGGLHIYGFGLKSRSSKAENYLISELLLLKKFITYFHEKNDKLIQLTYEQEVEMPLILDLQLDGELTNISPISLKRELFLKQLGLGTLTSLTSREIDVLKFLAYGFPANYIAKQLHLSCRTVENHIANIRSKLDCKSKVELILKAQEMISIINPL